MTRKEQQDRGNSCNANLKGHPMDEVEKLSKQLRLLHGSVKGIYEPWNVVARFVLRREIEARIDELLDVKLDNMIEDRLAELRRELEGLGEKCK